ncbi:MAG TPA: hypothetical protein VNA25_13530 [Phycisphaerae bacterium]|nr:hypothetical protein [Phycisphaerae bacterium]
MPIACDPDAKRIYVLKCDRARSLQATPRFFMRYLTRRQKSRYRKFGDELETSKLTADQMAEGLYKHVGEVLVGWENLHRPDGADVPYAADRLTDLDDVLTDRELWELYFAGMTELDGADLGFSGSQSSSSTGESASPADAPSA